MSMCLGGKPAYEATIRNLSNDRLSADDRRKQFDLLEALNAEQLRKSPGDSELEAVIESYELGYRIQNAAPGILDLSKETTETKLLYGIDRKTTASFGR